MKRMKRLYNITLILLLLLFASAGDAVGPGMVYGYVLPLGKRFNIEFSAGISLMWYREKRYEKGLPEPGDYNTTGHKVMPMGLGISCTYIFK